MSLPSSDLASSADCSPGGADRSAAYSRFVQRIRRRYAPWLGLLSAPSPLQPDLLHAYETIRQSGHEVGAALRILRQLVLERLVVIDAQTPGSAPLSAVTGAMTELAEFALDVAMQKTREDLDALHGRPQVTDGQATRRACMWVIGMGKLGARELNVSSDIDLIYVYDEQGQTAGRPDGRGVISNHEYFALQVKAVQTLIGDVTEHGFVFRVDLALRPNGNSGPPAVSLGALEEYFQVQGRE